MDPVVPNEMKNSSNIEVGNRVEGAVWFDYKVEANDQKHKISVTVGDCGTQHILHLPSLDQLIDVSSLLMGSGNISTNIVD